METHEEALVQFLGLRVTPSRAPGRQAFVLSSRAVENLRRVKHLLLASTEALKPLDMAARQMRKTGEP